MKTLFVNACVREESRTLALCRTYLARLAEQEPILLQEIELNESNLQPLTRTTLAQRVEDLRNGALDAYQYARDFAAADRIVIGTPYWDFSCPALLKTYLEHVCVNGITFGYPSGVPTGLCSAQELIYITTAGGYLAEQNSLELYLKELCALFGIPQLKFYKAEGLDIYGNDVEAILKQTASQF